MAAQRNYRSGDLWALATLSEKRCYWPDCYERIVRAVEGKYVKNVQIAHIRALKPNGPRYADGPGMSDEERNSFANLILLCHPHHTLVDKTEPEKYSVELLSEWKAAREADGQEALKGLHELTEERLQDLIVEALKERDEKIEQVLTRLKDSDEEAASLLQGLRDELSELRVQAPMLDPDMVSMLHEASNKLHLDSDAIRMLNEAAQTLDRIPDLVGSLNTAAATSLRLNHDAITTLNTAAIKLQDLPALIEALHAAAEELRRSQPPM